MSLLRNPAQHNRADTASTQLQVQLGAVEIGDAWSTRWRV